MNIRLLANNEAALAEVCRQKLEQALGVGVRLESAAGAHDRGYDFDLHLETHPPLHLVVEAKTRIATRNQALQIIFQLQRYAGEKPAAAVFADWIPEPAADEFRKAGIFYVDAQGNMFLRRPPQIMLDIQGRKPERPLKAEPGRLIEAGGLKVVHYLLTHPQAAGAPLRAIAQGAGVALGTAHAVRAELRRAQWLLPAADEKARFGDLKGLIELFVRGYALKLRPTCMIGRYQHKTKAPQEILQGIAQRLTGTAGQWAVTGGMAAREMTRYLEPDTVTLFVDEPARLKLAEEPMLRNDTGGNVTLLRLPDPTFVAEKTQGPWPLATPFLIYAELLQDGGQRELETAQMIYERFIEPQVPHGR